MEAITSPGQIVPDGQNVVKSIQGLNPDAGVVFALYNSLTGDLTKYVRVEKGKGNRILLAEVDASGNDLPGSEGEAPEEETFTGFPTYKQKPKKNIFEDLEDKSDFKAFDEPGA